MAENYNYNKLPNKKKVIAIADGKKVEGFINEKRLGLCVDIIKAIDIDNPYCDPPLSNRYYNVEFWLEPLGLIYCSQPVLDFLDPCWNTRWEFLLGNNYRDFIYLYLLRIGTKSDIGTSNGLTLVGKTRIELPHEINQKKQDWFDLVKYEASNFRFVGQIEVCMEIFSIED